MMKLTVCVVAAALSAAATGAIAQTAPTNNDRGIAAPAAADPAFRASTMATVEQALRASKHSGRRAPLTARTIAAAPAAKTQAPAK